MLILAFESSAKAASVALCRDGHLISQYSQCSGLVSVERCVDTGGSLLQFRRRMGARLREVIV